MDFQELIEKRYSVRAYKTTPVEEEKLKKILRAAQLAPTAANRQPFRVLVVHTAGREAELLRLYNQPWFAQVPLVLGVIGLPRLNWVRRDGHNYNDVDTAIVMDHIILAAADLGLGTCWIGAFNPDAAREVFRLPKEAEPVAFTPVGYPADTPKPKQRHTLTELVKYENW